MRRPVLAPLVLLMLLAPGVAAAEEPADAQLARTELSGRVVDPAGQPVAGARVLGVSAEARPQHKPRDLFVVSPETRDKLPVAETTTDEAGRFTIAVEGPAPFMLRADADGFAAARLLEVGGSEPATLRLATGWALTGQVLHRTTGKPLAGVEVEARPRTGGGFGDREHPDRLVERAESDDGGRFRIGDLEADTYDVVATAEGYTRATLPRIEVGLDSESPRPVYLYLEPGVTLRGRVVDAQGTAVSGVTVHVRPERLDMNRIRRWARTGDLDAKTGDDGSFTIRGAPPAPSYQLEAGHDDYAPAWLTGIEVKAGSGSPELTIRLDRGTSLTAQLVADGRPFEGELSAVLTYTDKGGGQFKPRVSREGKHVELEQGRVTIANLPPGKASLSLRPDGFEAIEREGLTLPEERPLELGEILLETGLRITGKVLGEDGRPLADASVEITAMGAGRFARSSAKTAADGGFVAGGLEQLAYTVTASAEGYGKATREDVEPDGDPLVLELARAGAIRGRVLAGDPPQPLRGFSVTPQGKATPGVPFQMQAALQARARLSYNEPAGEFRVDGLTGDTYSLKIEATGHVASRVEKVTVTPGQTADVGDVVLERGVTLHGSVTERDGGRPIGGASVSLEEPGLFNVGAFMNFDRASEITGPDGKFMLSGLAPGRHTVKVEHESFSPGKSEVEIAAGIPPAPLVVELGHGGAIEGTYRDPDGKPVNGGMVIAMLGFTPSPNAVTSADEVGHFRIENLTPGSYRVMAMGNPIEARGDQQALMAGMQMQSAEVVDGKTTVVNIPAQSGGISVSGVVRKGSERLEARLFWVRMAADGASAEDFSIGVSDESGAYQVRLSEPGDYRVSVQPLADAAEWGPGMALRVEVPADVESVTQDLVIPEIVLSGAVLDGDSGLPLRDVRVLALEHHDDRALADSIAVGSATSDEQGAWSLPGLAEGEVRLVLSKEGYGAVTLDPLAIDDGERETVNVTLFPASPVVVSVVDAQGAPVEGALVYALSGPLMAVAGGSAETDMNGEATLSGLAEGTHELGVLATGLAPAIASGVTVDRDAAEPTVIELRRGARLRIRVVDAEERPVSNAAVRVREVEGSDLTPLLRVGAVFKGRGMITGPDGTLDVPNLEAGRYEVEVRWEQFVADERVRVRLDRDNVVEVELR